MNAPFVMQCRGCRCVISDSNQLVGTVEALDALVLDAVLGVRIDVLQTGSGKDAGCKFSALKCSSCGGTLGRKYSSATPELHMVVSRDSQPRYTLRKEALLSYVLGSTGSQHNAALQKTAAEGGSGAGATEEGARDVPADAPWSEQQLIARLLRLEEADPAMQAQMAKVYRVILSMDERVNGLERSAGKVASPGRKRAR
jgi:hypothetical protein